MYTYPHKPTCLEKKSLTTERGRGGRSAFVSGEAIADISQPLCLRQDTRGGQHGLDETLRSVFHVNVTVEFSAALGPLLYHTSSARNNDSAVVGSDPLQFMMIIVVDCMVLYIVPSPAIGPLDDVEADTGIAGIFEVKRNFIDVIVDGDTTKGIRSSKAAIFPHFNAFVDLFPCQGSIDFENPGFDACQGRAGAPFDGLGTGRRV